MISVRARTERRTASLKLWCPVPLETVASAKPVIARSRGYSFGGVAVKGACLGSLLDLRAYWAAWKGLSISIMTPVVHAKENMPDKAMIMVIMFQPSGMRSPL